MSFYSDLVDIASNLLTEFGKPVTVRQEKSDTDKTNPWEGKTDDVQTYSTVAVFDKFFSKYFDKALVEKGDLFAYVPSKGEGFEIKLKDFIVEGSTKYSIVNLEKIEPGPTNIMYILQLRL